MKHLLLFASFITIWITQSAAQAPIAAPKTIVKGIIIDSVTNQPLPFVTVVVKNSGSNVPLKSTLTKDNGSFELAVAITKTNQLGFAYLGYKAKTINLSSAVDGVIDVKKVVLSPATGQLKEVTVNEAKPMIKQEVDRIGYDVQADPEAKELSALDMMRKVPLLTVDPNDAIQLKGSANYKILINGKESALMAKDPSDVLKSMPATNIEKIEVITTPPAKYDAEGLAGIINIITKKNADQGYNASINGRYNSAFGPGINFNGTLKKGKFGLAGYIGDFDQGTVTTTSTNNQTFLTDRSALAQTNSNTRTGNGHYEEADLSYEIDTLNLITSSIDLFNGYNNNSSSDFSIQRNGAGATSQQYALANTGYSNYTGLDASLNYELGFKRRKGQLLTLSYKFSFSPNAQFNDNSFSERAAFTQPNYRQYNNSGSRDHTIQVDYAQPINKLNVEAGAKAILRNNFSNFQSDTLNKAGTDYNLNNGQTNDFNYHQDVYSLYNSYQLKLEKWTGKAGLRIEHTQVDANFASVGSSSFNDSYSNLIPSVSAQRSFKSSSITLGYTQRIQRPGIYQLNPFVDQSNPKFISTGNQSLKPELSNTFELNYSNFAKNAINVGLNYAFSDNSIQNVTYTAIQYPTGGKPDTVTINTYQNLGSNKTLGLNVNTSLSIGKNVSISLSGQVRSVWLKGTYNGQFYTNQGFTGNGYGNATYKFGDGFRFGMNGSFFTGNVNLQGRNGYGIYSSVLLSKDFLKKNLTLAAVCNNPWAKYQNYTSYTNTPVFDQTSINQNIYRTFAIRFNYKFGRLDSEIKKNQHGINNDDTKSGGTTSSGK